MERTIRIEEHGDQVVVETDYLRRRRSFLQSLANLLFSGGERVPFVAVDCLVTVPGVPVSPSGLSTAT